MPDYASQISEIIGAAPADLVEDHSTGHLPDYPDSRIHCLPFAEAKDNTRQMREIPVVERLGLWILDDANDSNPFAYISAGPCRGMIIHFSHDPEPEMAFSSLAKFLAALRDAGARELDIDDLENESIKVDPNSEIRALAAEGSDDATLLLTVYLPVSAALQNETMAALVAHNDFYVREAFAAFLARNPSPKNLSIAERLSADPHGQVAREGRKAVAAIRSRASG